MIKLSAPDWCFYREEIGPGAYYEKLREIGYNGVEMVDPVRWPAARAAGLSILNIAAPGIDQGLCRKEHHDELLPRISDAIALAAQNEIPHVIIYSGMGGGLADDEGMKNCRHGIERLLPETAGTGVTLVFEMLNIHDHPDHQANRGSYGFELARQISSPHLKILYDIYHMERMGDDGAADIIAQLPLISHLHVAESPGRGCPQADGTIKYNEIVPKVIAAGYEGYWGMEFEPGQDVLAELTKAGRLFMEF